APTVPNSKANANLNNLVSKEKSAKPTQKHILCSEVILWPRPSKSLEETILSRLSKILKDVPNIFQSKKSTNKSEKERIRSQLEIGTSSVLRALERDSLQCVLVSGKATPAITVDHVISLGKDKSCPLLCLDGLSASVAAALESKSFPLCIGFRKLKEGQQSDFSEVISLVKENTHVEGAVSNTLPARHVLPQPAPSLMDKSPLSSEDKSTQRAFRVNADDETEILAEVKRVFSSAINVTPKVAKRKKHSGKKNVKESFDKDLHHQFEAGKRAVIGAVERDRLEIVLVSHELEEVLSGSPLLRKPSPLSGRGRPPVILLPGLSVTLREMTSGACGISFLGIKKLQLLPSDGKQNFKTLIDLCSRSLERAKKPEASSDIQNTQSLTASTNTRSLEIASTACRQKNNREEEMEEVEEGGEKNGSKEQKEVEEKSEEEEEEEDYSYLYTLKKDSSDLLELRAAWKEDFERSEKDAGFSSDFISLSASGGDSIPQIAKNNFGTVKKMTSVPPRSNRVDRKILTGVTHQHSASDKSPGTRLHMETKESCEPAPHAQTSVADVTSKVACSSESGAITQAPDESKEIQFISFTEQDKETARDVSSLDNQTNNGHQITGIFGAANKPKTLDLEHDSTGAGTSPFQTSVDPSSSSFIVDRSGVGSSGRSEIKSLQKSSSSSTHNRRPSDPEQKQEVVPSTRQGGVLGTDALKPQKGKEGLDVLSLDVAVRSKHKSKALKRKMEQEEGFISFKYTEANIKTMVSNPSKKKKKKKNK
ncbi:hypothetical protein EGW08_023267, partial [Elysia chlorotica]